MARCKRKGLDSPKKGLPPKAKTNNKVLKKIKHTKKPRRRSQIRQNMSSSEFVCERAVAVSNSQIGSNITITCKNDMVQGSSSGDFDSVMLDARNKITDENKMNLSLASFAKKQLDKTKTYMTRRTLKSRKFKLDNDIIALDSSGDSEDDVIFVKSEVEPLKENKTPLEDSIVMVDDPSLIIIDDEANERVSENKNNDQKVVSSQCTETINNNNEQIDSKINAQELAGPSNMNVIDLTETVTSDSDKGSRNEYIPPAYYDMFPPPPYYPPVQSAAATVENPLLEYIHTTNNYVFSQESPRNLLGNNFLCAGPVRTTGLRPIFIDGSNVAMGHSNGRYFSVKGVAICIDYFKLRGHEVTAIIPQIKRKRNQTSDPNLLEQLAKEGTVIFTPSRVVNGKHVIPYDDRFIVQLAAVYHGIVISCDNYRDLLLENPNLRDTIEKRVLTPTWLKDTIIFPADPLGRYGPNLDTFLRFP